MNQQDQATRLAGDAKRDLRARMLSAGYTISAFARANGYRVQTVDKVLSRYSGTDRQPRGTLSREIMAGVRRLVGASPAPAQPPDADAHPAAHGAAPGKGGASHGS